VEHRWKVAVFSWSDRGVDDDRTFSLGNPASRIRILIARSRFTSLALTSRLRSPFCGRWTNCNPASAEEKKKEETKEEKTEKAGDDLKGTEEKKGGRR